MTTTTPSATGPVLVLQHMANDGPAYFATFLRRHGVPFTVRDTSKGDDFPEDLGEHRALAVLGGEMSVNDDLPSLRRAESLVRQAMAAGRPVIGHCLGGQLMASAMGARIGASPRPEVGWHAVRVDDDPLAHDWFGSAPGHHVFHWHGEAFELPPGARRLATNASCPNQAFCIGPHLAMQFHVEVDAAKLNAWFADATDPAARAAFRAIEAEPALAASRLAAQHALADRLYERWLLGMADRAPA